MGIEIRLALLTGGIPNSEKERIKELLSTGEIHIVVATHAILQDDVEFHRLGLVVTDEQHRFGVRQRATIIQKGNKTPHILVMSATPIPRTMALTLYGDLDISIIDELPPGRKPVKTYHVPSSLLATIISRMAGILSSSKNICSVRHSPIPSAPKSSAC